MMEIKRLTWDSDFFGITIGEILVPYNTDINSSYDLLVVKQMKDENFDFQGYEKKFQETKVIFVKKLISKFFKCDLGYTIYDTDKNKIVWNSLRELAYESGKMSRFKLDINFGIEKFHQLYDQWLINSLNKKFAIKTFYIVNSENKPIGFITLQRDGVIGKIGLIATHPKWQGRGIGKALLKHVENYCVENEICSLEIPTQESNIQACSFYNKLGYKIKNKIIIKHYWKV